jgi:uncharacterized protein YgiM (DUF1202 family)
VFKKLTLAAAAGAGYVLGAKAGKERYAQIESKFRELAGMPAVQSATATVIETASGVADSAKTTVNEKVEAVTDKASSRSAKGDTDVVVDLGTSTGTGTGTAAGTGANTGATMAGAAPSGSAPDITRP